MVKDIVEIPSVFSSSFSSYFLRKIGKNYIHQITVKFLTIKNKILNISVTKKDIQKILTDLSFRGLKA